MDVVSQIKRLRRCDTPIIGVRTADPTALLAQYAEASKNGLIVRWDSVQGMVGVNPEAKQVLIELLPSGDILGVDPAVQTRSPVEALALAAKLPESTVLWCVNLHLSISDPLVVQAVANLRDTFKGSRRTLVLAGVDLRLPPELTQDILTIDESLPNDDELAQIVTDIYDGSEGLSSEDLDDDTRQRAVDALRGLSAFGAEQVAAMAVTAEGIDLDAAWEQKRSTIEQVDGVTYDRMRPTFKDIGGLANIKKLGKALIESPKHPALVVLLDEIEKAFGGLGVAGGPGDSSGTTQDALGVLLRWMEEDNASGIICVGPPGSGKSLFSRALGATGGVPSISVDLGAAKGSLVGESERKVRAVVRTIKGLSAGRQVFVVATCNRLSVLPPELRRRFRLGIVFFDLPTKEERKAIWDLNLKKHKIKKQKLPEDNEWTGAEIRNCCELADQLNVGLKEAASYIVPIAKAMSDTIQELRRTASGRFLSASASGTYTMPSVGQAAAPVRRKVRTKGDA